MAVSGAKVRSPSRPVIDQHCRRGPMYRAWWRAGGEGAMLYPLLVDASDETISKSAASTETRDIESTASTAPSIVTGRRTVYL